MAKATNSVPGASDLVTFRTTAAGPESGWAIGNRIQSIPRQALQIQEDSPRSASHQWERQVWGDAERGPADARRVAEFCPLTRAGRSQLQKELGSRHRISAAINLVVRQA